MRLEPLEDRRLLAAGDTGVGNPANVVIVDAQDRAAVREHAADFTSPATVDNPHDLNRDRLMDDLEGLISFDPSIHRRRAK